MALFSHPNSSKTATTDLITNQFASEIIRQNEECYIIQFNTVRIELFIIAEISLHLNTT